MAKNRYVDRKPIAPNKAAKKTGARIQKGHVRGKGGASRSRVSVESRLQNQSMHHRQSANEALQRAWQRPISSLLIWLVIGVALALPMMFYVAVTNLQGLGKGFDQQANISVFFAPWIEEQRARELAYQWLEWPEVAAVDFISAHEGLMQFQQDTGISLQTDTVNPGDSPLPAMAVVTPHKEFAEALQLESLAERLNAVPETIQAKLDMEWLKKLQSVLLLLEEFSFALGIFFALAVLLIVGNSIRMAIAERHHEIEVIKLIGATDAYVSRPFLYTGIWYGVFGGLLALILVFGLSHWLTPFVENIATEFNGQFELQSLNFFDSLMVLFAAAVLGLIGAWLAVSRQISEIEPS